MNIVEGLLLGWILGLFGFKGVVIAGMWQLFGVKITVLGYYFIFAMLGVFSWIISMFKKPKVQEPMAKYVDQWANKYKK